MLKEESAFADVRLLAAVSCGGVLGALARYGLQTAYPHTAREFGWATLFINVSGCLLITIIAVLIASARLVPTDWSGRSWSLACSVAIPPSPPISSTSSGRW